MKINPTVKNQNIKRGFTLIELIITFGVIGMVVSIAVVAINPAEMLKKSRDTRRIADLVALYTALQLAYSQELGFGTCDGTKIYASLPSSDPLSNDNLPSGVSWNQVSDNNLYKVDGAGWIPVNFASLGGGSPLSVLPVDPKKSSSNNLFYTYTCNSLKQFTLTAWFESQYYGPKGANPQSKNDGGPDPYLYEVGSHLSLSPLKPIGVWSFDEGSGTIAYDSSGSNLTASVSGSWEQSCKIGSCLSVSGGAIAASVSDTTGSPLDLAGSLTISFWLYPISYVSGYAYHPINKWTGTADANYVIYYFGDAAGGDYKYMRPYANCGGAWQSMNTGKIVDTLNEWHHIVWSYNPTIAESKFYVNGALASTASRNCTLAVNNASLNIGAQQSGKIDEVRIYNRTLSAAEIKAIYDATK